MGITHEVKIPQNSSIQEKFTVYDPDVIQHCPWTYATLMTTGDISVSDISSDEENNDFSTSNVYQSYYNRFDYKFPSRAPPKV